MPYNVSDTIIPEAHGSLIVWICCIVSPLYTSQLLMPRQYTAMEVLLWGSMVASCLLCYLWIASYLVTSVTKLSDNTATSFAWHFYDGQGPRIYLAGGCVADQVRQIALVSIENAVIR